MKYGTLKEKTMPKHGKVVDGNEPRKFVELPKAARGEEPEERGKIRTPHSPMSATEALGKMRFPSVTNWNKKEEEEVEEESKETEAEEREEQELASKKRGRK